MARSQIVIKRYKSDREYQNDAKKMVLGGYEVQSVVSEQPRSGCGRILLIGIFAAIFKPKPVLVVTYRSLLQDYSRGNKDPRSQTFSTKKEKSKIQEFNGDQDSSDNQSISKW